jgi:hypothetical protein
MMKIAAKAALALLLAAGPLMIVASAAQLRLGPPDPHLVCPVGCEHNPDACDGYANCPLCVGNRCTACQDPLGSCFSARQP